MVVRGSQLKIGSVPLCVGFGCSMSALGGVAEGGFFEYANQSISSSRIAVYVRERGFKLKCSGGHDCYKKRRCVLN